MPAEPAFPDEVVLAERFVRSLRLLSAPSVTRPVAALKPVGKTF